MKVTAFITNCCGSLLQEDKVLGLIYKPDLFDNYKDYNVVAPDKSDIHFCLQCYNTYVSNLFKKENIDRSKDEVKYNKLYNQYSHNFKQMVYFKANNITIKKHGKKQKNII